MYFQLPFVSRKLFEQLEADIERLSKVVNEQHHIISAQREELVAAKARAAGVRDTGQPETQAGGAKVSPSRGKSKPGKKSANGQKRPAPAQAA